MYIPKSICRAQRSITPYCKFEKERSLEVNPLLPDIKKNIGSAFMEVRNEDYAKRGGRPPLQGEMEIGAATMGYRTEVPYKSKTEPPYDPANLLVSIHPENT